MSQFALRISDSLHGYAKEMAQADHTSLNQFIVTAVAEKISALNIEEFFR
jgi:predicted HicB family RNase H-like nuclease